MRRALHRERSQDRSPLDQAVKTEPVDETRPPRARQSTADHTADIARVATEREKEEKAKAAGDKEAESEHKPSLAETLDKRMRGLFGGKASSESLSEKRGSMDSSRRGSHDPPHASGRATPPLTDSSSNGGASSIATLPKPDPSQGPTIKTRDAEGNIIRTLATPSPPPAATPVAAAAAA